MKYKKNGFTLIELLSVIVILAIILIIAVPNITNVINKSKEDSYLSQKKMIIDATSKYVLKEGNNITWNSDVAYVTLLELQSNNLIDNPLNNPKGGTIGGTTRVVLTKDTEGDIHYEVSLPEELTYYLTKENSGSNGTFKYKNGANFFIGKDPNNWIQFGKDASNNDLMWRIIKVDEEGIKIIYEGVKNGVSAPTANGRITIDGSTTTPWDYQDASTGSNKWDRPATLKAKLATWYNSLQINIKDINPIHWCLGGSGQNAGYSTTPVLTSCFLSTECVDGTYGSNTFKGKTIEATGYGMIRVSDYLSASSSSDCIGSYYDSGNNNKDCGITGGISTNFLFKSAYAWWTYTAYGSFSYRVWNVYFSGCVLTNLAYNTTIAVRPVLNLKSSVLYSSGSGTLANPYVVQ